MSALANSSTFQGTVLTTQIIGIISGVILLCLINSNAFKTEYDIIMILITIGLLLYNGVYIVFVFVFENIYDAALSWLYIIGVGASVCSYLFSLLLSYSVYTLLVHKRYTYLWDAANRNFSYVVLALLFIAFIFVTIGIMQFYSPLLREDSAVQLLALFSKVFFSLCSLGLYIKCECHIRSQIIEEIKLSESKLSEGERPDSMSQQRLNQSREVVHSLFMYPLLQLICVAPLFITSIANNLQVDEIHNLEVQSPMFAGFAFSYAILYLDMFFMLISYVLLNKQTAKTFWSSVCFKYCPCINIRSTDKLADSEEIASAQTSNRSFTAADFESYRASDTGLEI